MRRICSSNGVCPLYVQTRGIAALAVQKKKRGLSSLLSVTGNVLLSRVVSNQVPSALKGLTAVFGMGTGVSPSPLPPVSLSALPAHSQLHSIFLPSKGPSSLVCDQALDLLVSVSSTHCCAYTPDLSPCSLQGVLLPYDMGYLILRWVSRLDAFSVYPVQTSLPSCATRRDNWCTIGLSIPVLSY